jgi:hypothetical protein
VAAGVEVGDGLGADQAAGAGDENFHLKITSV